MVADEARNLLLETFTVNVPVPVGEQPADLLKSAERLLSELCHAGAPPAVHDLRAQLVELVWEANTSAGA